MTVYLLHLSDPMPQGDDPRTGKPRAAQHYIGFTTHLTKRLEHHRSGNGSKMLRAAGERGIEFEVAQVWKGADRNFERRLHNQKNSPRLCPICKQKRKEVKL